MSGTLKIGGKTLATHDTNSNKLSFHPDANDTGQLCRAWVNFDGVNQTIRGAYNISSISYATGDYTVNFATAMPDANYATSVASSRKSGELESFPNTLGVSRSPSTTSTRIYGRNAFSGNVEDVSDCFVTIFR